MGKSKILIAVIVIVVIGGIMGFVFLTKGKSSDTGKVDTVTTSSDETKQIKPEEIGLTLTPKSDKKSVIIKATKLDGISSLEYEVTYDAKGGIPRGVIGEIKVPSGQSSVSKDVLLGTCSKNVCKYDEGVEKVHLLLKVNYTNGSTGEVELDATL